MKLYEVSPQCVGWKVFNVFDCAGNTLFCANCFANNAGDPETPAAGYVAIYAKSNSIHQKNSSGTVTDLGAGGGSSLWIDATNPFICPCNSCSICVSCIGSAAASPLVFIPATAAIFCVSTGNCITLEQNVANNRFQSTAGCIVEWDMKIASGTGTFYITNSGTTATVCVCVDAGLAANMFVGSKITTAIHCGTSCVASPTICGTTVIVSPVLCGSTCINGAIICATSVITPDVCNTLDVGTTVKRWRCIITCSIDADDQINIKDTIPKVTCVYNNGDATHRWANVYTVVVNCSSDCTQKEILSEFDGNKVLERYTQVPIYDWCWCNKDKTKTIGITAQDFSRSFGELVDLDSCTSINGTTHDGLQDAAIKELILCVKKLESQLGGKDNGNSSICS